jgi:hypothetical protein
MSDKSSVAAMDTDEILYKIFGSVVTEHAAGSKPKNDHLEARYEIPLFSLVEIFIVSRQYFA